MDEVLELAQKLGAAIARHDRYRALVAARKSLDADEQAMGLNKALIEQTMKIAELEDKQAPVEPEDKRELKRLQDETRANPALQEFARAEADYVEVMNKVNRAIQEALDGEG